MRPYSSIPEKKDSSTLSWTDHVCHIKNFNFISGQHLSELNLRYSTLGTPEYDASGYINNAVVLMHASTGNRLHWLSNPLASKLFFPGQALDVKKYFVVVPDFIGHGQSSKPSDGLRTDFPNYRCHDLATSVHLLITKGLGIKRLKLLMGTSLGAMVAWVWGQLYPDSIERIVPIGAYPLPLAGRNWIIRRMSIDAIRKDPEWHSGHYTSPPKHYLCTAPLLILLAHGVRQLHHAGPDQLAADRFYQTLVDNIAKHDTNDLLYVLEATQGYDPSPNLENTTARVLAINFAGDELCRPDMAELSPTLQRLPYARFVVIPETPQGFGHFTYYLPDSWVPYLVEFMK